MLRARHLLRSEWCYHLRRWVRTRAATGDGLSQPGSSTTHRHHVASLLRTAAATATTSGKRRDNRGDTRVSSLAGWQVAAMRRLSGELPPDAPIGDFIDSVEFRLLDERSGCRCPEALAQSVLAKLRSTEHPPSDEQFAALLPAFAGHSPHLLKEAMLIATDAGWTLGPATRDALLAARIERGKPVSVANELESRLESGTSITPRTYELLARAAAKQGRADVVLELSRQSPTAGKDEMARQFVRATAAAGASGSDADRIVQSVPDGWLAYAEGAAQRGNLAAVHLALTNFARANGKAWRTHGAVHVVEVAKILCGAEDGSVNQLISLPRLRHAYQLLVDAQAGGAGAPPGALRGRIRGLIEAGKVELATAFLAALPESDRNTLQIEDVRHAVRNLVTGGKDGALSNLPQALQASRALKLFELDKSAIVSLLRTAYDQGSAEFEQIWRLMSPGERNLDDVLTVVRRWNALKAPILRAEADPNSTAGERLVAASKRWLDLDDWSGERHLPREIIATIMESADAQAQDIETVAWAVKRLLKSEQGESGRLGAEVLSNVVTIHLLRNFDEDALAGQQLKQFLWSTPPPPVVLTSYIAQSLGVLMANRRKRPQNTPDHVSQVSDYSSDDQDFVDRLKLVIGVLRSHSLGRPWLERADGKPVARLLGSLRTDYFVRRLLEEVKLVPDLRAGAIDDADRDSWLDELSSALQKSNSISLAENDRRVELRLKALEALKRPASARLLAYPLERLTLLATDSTSGTDDVWMALLTRAAESNAIITNASQLSELLAAFVKRFADAPKREAAISQKIGELLKSALDSALTRSDLAVARVVWAHRHLGSLSFIDTLSYALLELSKDDGERRAEEILRSIDESPSSIEPVQFRKIHGAAIFSSSTCTQFERLLRDVLHADDSRILAFKSSARNSRLRRILDSGDETKLSLAIGEAREPFVNAAIAHQLIVAALNSEQAVEHLQGISALLAEQRQDGGAKFELAAGFLAHGDIKRARKLMAAPGVRIPAVTLRTLADYLRNRKQFTVLTDLFQSIVWLEDYKTRADAVALDELLRKSIEALYEAGLKEEIVRLKDAVEKAGFEVSAENATALRKVLKERENADQKGKGKTEKRKRRTPPKADKEQQQ